MDEQTIHRNGENHNGKNLFRRLTILLGGNPPNIGQIQLAIKSEFDRQYPRFFIAGEQVELIWKNVPDIFPEDADKIKRSYEWLKNKQKKAYKEIAASGKEACPIIVIKSVIRLGIEMENNNGHLLSKKNISKTDSG